MNIKEYACLADILKFALFDKDVSEKLEDLHNLIDMICPTLLDKSSLNSNKKRLEDIQTSLIIAEFSIETAYLDDSLNEWFMEFCDYCISEYNSRIEKSQHIPIWMYDFIEDFVYKNESKSFKSFMSYFFSALNKGINEDIFYLNNL